mmetsp:Transcript_21749/g.31228  ORF Transcript_21749/g.31228 Transcript_21749/m.31228 type:complete len:434 (+) Transcript_21749:18-1319(+)
MNTWFRNSNFLYGLVIGLFIVSFLSSNERAEDYGRGLQSTSRELVKGKNSFRIATFGSAQTWGAGMDSRYGAYPYLLSNEVDNYAFFSAGPNYPSVCTESLIGDDHLYDVIVLEYWLKAREGLPELARRLRQRFPQAVIIMLKIWGPYHGRRVLVDNNGTATGVEMTFREWKESVGGGNIAKLSSLLRNDTCEWYFPEHHQADEIIAEAAKNTSSFIVEIPHSGDAKTTIADHLDWFEEFDNAHLSPTGHAVVANHTRGTIMNALMGESVLELANSGTYGNWGEGDDCHLWYTTGGASLSYSDTLKMNEFNNDLGKFALEVTDDAGGWFEVDNPFSDNRMLYLSYLATDEGVYPKTNITISGVSLTLNPVTTLDKKKANLIHTVPVIELPHGVSTINIIPLEKTSEFFRLVGLTFTNGIAVPLEYGFGPQFNL